MRKLIKYAIILAAISGQASALVSGDKVVCYDDVSNEKYTAKLVDLGDEEAYVRIEGLNPRFYSSSQVVFNANSEISYFVMLNKSGIEVEALTIPVDASKEAPFFGTYSDRGDSRAVDCVIK